MSRTANFHFPSNLPLPPPRSLVEEIPPLPKHTELIA